MKILVLDATNQNTLAIVRHLGKAGYEIHTAGYQRQALSFYSKYCRKKIILPHPDRQEKKFIKELLQCLQGESYQLLMPVGFLSYKACAKYQEEIRKYTKLTLTSSENIELAASKDATYKLAEELGIPFPGTYPVFSETDFESLNADYPLVIKAPFESGKNVVEYARDKEDAILKYRNMIVRNNYSAPNLPLVQEYVVGDGYGFFAYYEKGRCINYFMHHRIREYPVTGGASVCAESFYDDELMILGKKMLDHLLWDGVAMVEFKKDRRSGLYKLMEINPKFWGSLELAIVSGVDFPGMLVQRAEGRTVQVVTKYKQLKFQWLINGELFHFFERPSAVLKILSTLFRSKSDFRWTDPLPNCFQVANIFVHYFKKWFRS